MTGKAILLNKQVWLAIGAITFVGAVVVTGTGAFFSDSANVTGNTFAVGTMDLKLTQNEDGGSPADTQSALWDFTNMAPGGDSKSASVWLRNVGSVDGSTVGVGIASGWTNPSNIAAQMRITEMTFDGNNLLEGGAGHNFGLYEAPANCDVEVNYGANDYTRISEAVDAATAGQVICVGAGNYNTAWESSGTGFPIQIDTDNVILASVDGPSATTIGGGIIIDNPGVTLTGFTIEEGSVNGSGDRYAVKVYDGDAEVSFNKITGLANANSNRATQGIHVYDAGDNITIQHNHIEDLDNGTNWGVYGVIIQADSGNVTVSYNTIEDLTGVWTGGVSATPSASAGGLPGPATITYNQFGDMNGTTYPGTAFYIDTLSGASGPVGYASTFSVNYNNFDSGIPVAVANKDTSEVLDAENNWWGDFDPSDQVSGDVDYEPFAGGPFAGLVNGSDANGNGFADLRDLRDDSITGITPGLDAYDGDNDKEFVMSVQLDGPTTGNNFQGLVLDDVEIEFTLNQI